MARTKKNATTAKPYRGWTIEVSGRGPGRWDVVAGKHGSWYGVGLLEGPVSEAFQAGKDWVDSRSTLRGRFRGLQDEPLKHRRNNPCIGLHLHQDGLMQLLAELEKRGALQRNPCVMVGDYVRLPSGEEGEVETVVRGQVFVRTAGRQLRGAHQDDIVLLKGGSWRETPSGHHCLNPGVPSLKQWRKEKDDCDQWTYELLTEKGRFIVWQPSSDPAYGCTTDGTWQGAFLTTDGRAGFQSGALADPKAAVEWAKRQDMGARAAADPALKRKLMGGGGARRRAVRNPTARPLYVDDLTGTRTSHLVPGATRTAQRIVRTRPAKGQPFEVVEAHSDTLDPSRDTFGVDPGFTDFYRQEAARVAKAAEKIRQIPAAPRDADIELGKLGIPTSFKNVEAAMDLFEDGNEAFFLNRQMDDLDAGDVTLDFMDRLEVARGRRGKQGGRKHVPLSQTARGQEILSFRGHRQVRELIKYLFGQAGRRRRWKDVPWYMIEEYMSQISTLMGDEAYKGTGSSSGSEGGIYWFPLASGMIADNEFLTRAAEEIGPQRAGKLQRHLNSQELWNLVGRLEEILKPPKGPNGKEGRAALKCIPKEDKKILRHRLRVLTDWAKWPELVPEWACVPDEHVQTMTSCTYPGIWEDIQAVREACSEPYDASWPQRQRAELWRDGAVTEEELYGTGLYPMSPDELPGRSAATEEVEELDLPWETAANPGLERLKRKLKR